jgi:Undecaprenyl-phosphate glucose phosphotransferase
VVLTAWGTACFLRFHTPIFGGPALFDARAYVIAGLGMLPVWFLLIRARGLYEPRRGVSRWLEAREIVAVGSIASLGLAAAPFFWREIELSRVVVGIFWVLSTGGLVAFRATLREVLARARGYGFNQRRVLIVGTGVLAGEVYRRFVDHRETGFRVVGFVGAPEMGGPRIGPPLLGSFQDVARVVEEKHIDQLVVAVDRSDPVDPIKLLHELHQTTTAVRIVPDLRGLPNVQAGIEEFDGLPMIRLIESPLLGWNRVRKRALDVAVASIGLVAISPLLAGIAAAIRLTAPGGSVLYRQKRMGLDGRLFWILKFRTMVPNAEAETGPRWAEPDDPRRTRLGAFLRRWNLDELPQLVNVLRGEMSLVGPRPERPEFIEKFRAQLPEYMLRHKMKAGMTGWAQINGWRGQTSIEKRLEHDIEYARRWSLRLDVKIIALTFFRNFRDPNAY